MKPTRPSGFVAVAAAILVVASLGACSSSSSSSSDAGSESGGLAGAKSATLKLESQIAAFVPADMVTDTQKTTVSKVIYPCLGHSDQSYWPGTETVSVKPGVDNDAVLTSIASNWTNKDGWTVFQSTGDDGNKSLSIKSDKGQSFKVQFVDGPQLSITSLSSCFPNDGLSGKSSY